MSNYEPVIGLEIHIQLKTKSKLFCASPNSFNVESPNTNICEICTGQPGTLPRLNAEALRKAIMVGLALNCETAKITKFDRKNYFYPDLPKGYQISQFDMPINGKGKVMVGNREIGITRAHLEEDAGKLLHELPGSDLKSSQRSDPRMTYVDFNRAGVPLLEVVTEPDFKSPEEAGLFLRQLRSIVRYLDASMADMEKGHLRVDANVSVRKIGETKLPDYKVEVKNMNSFKAVEAALSYEIERQTELLEKGEKPIDETRGFVDHTKTTVSQRTKEAAHDYRYFPEPDLPPIAITDDFIQELRIALPELPQAKAKRFIKEYDLPESDVWQIVDDKSFANYFENVASELGAWFEADNISVEKYKKSLKSLANWLTGDFLAMLNRDGKTANESGLSPENFAELIKLIEQGVISNTAGKSVLTEMYATGGDPSDIVDRQNLGQVSDEGLIEGVIDKVLAANQEVVEKYKAGKTGVLGALVGEVMKQTDGRANPQLVNEILKTKLD
ncbi:MAG: glutaminyl-tRNA synthase (glutamine-hydrolyzing) subunit B [Candidatus Doudnabacteria bacterium RIFCSPHIGHO2_02_FULL_46_11]|uniref:Aspartyl/glutamyl-tRNA(Asn/Gln) amidotransferase subunit B n=1 Tax=Candidatus Doudnabacteria bacterium RIFCSPHIGHO2_02_FULL_46_11 TaxID=1817832 RepID=A0A1F5P4Q8_9BACT|nr:MAG: glutaminyl-tRNA synthase (glutamine-hydrolyzing) subunit B [Candidatus Doudnabacteria bacterium RIFCSPHIGHO2_02_FULL_46_11]